MISSRGPIDPQLPGFPGGYAVSIPNIAASEAPAAAARIGLGAEATMGVAITNQRWDRIVLAGTRGHVLSSIAATDQRAPSARLDLSPGVNRPVPEGVRQALAELDDSMRAFAAGRPATGSSASIDARDGYVTLKTRPIPVPLDTKPDVGILVALTVGDPLADRVRTAAAAFADAMAVRT